MQCLAMLGWLRCPHRVGVCSDTQRPWSQGCVQYINAATIHKAACDVEVPWSQGCIQYRNALVTWLHLIMKCRTHRAACNTVFPGRMAAYDLEML